MFSSLNFYITKLKISIFPRTLLLTFIGRGFAASGSVLLTLIVAHKFPIAIAGDFVTAFALLISLSFVTRFGFDMLVVKSLPTLDRKLEETQAFLRQVTGVAWFLSLTLSALVRLGGLMFSLGLSAWVWIALVPYGLINLNGAILRSRGLFGFGAFMEAGLAALIAAILLLVLPLSAFQAWLVLAACGWSVLAISYGALYRHQLLTRPQWSLAGWPYLIEARFFGLTQIFSNLTQWGGLFLVAALMSSAVAAETNAMFRLIAPFQFIFLTLDFYLGPQFSKTLQTKSSFYGVRKFRSLGIRVALVLATPFLLCLVVAGDLMINFLLGTAYQSILFPLVILGLAHLFVLALGANGILLTVTGQEKIVFYATLTRASTALLFYLILIPKWGLWAVCLVYSFIICAEALFFLWAAKKQLQYLSFKLNSEK